MITEAFAIRNQLLSGSDDIIEGMTERLGERISGRKTGWTSAASYALVSAWAGRARAAH